MTIRKAAAGMRIEQTVLLRQEGDLPDPLVVVPRVQIADGRLDRRRERLHELRQQQQARRRRVTQLGDHLGRAQIRCR